MRKLFCFSLLLMLFLLAQGHAEVTLHLQSDSVSPGQTVLIGVSGATGEVMYDIYRDGELLVRSEFTSEKTGAYIPKASGSYRVRVTERSTGSAAEKTFQVTGPLSVSMNASDTSATVGGSVFYSAAAKGGAGSYVYTFSVMNGNTRILAEENTEGTFTYPAWEEGQYNVECRVTDGQKAAASASSALSVTAQKQEISVLPDSSGPFRLYGGVRAFTVRSSGVWTVTCDSSLVSLSRDSGRNGDTLVATVLPGTDEPLRAVLTFTCGDSSCTEEIRRLTGDGIEREVHFSPVDHQITIDGSILCVWENAENSREFPVISTSSWTGKASADWIHISTTADGNLTVAADDPDGTPRAGYVYIFNEESGAYLSVFQAGSAPGPSIDQIILSEDQDGDPAGPVTAEVYTHEDADRILVYSTAGDEPIASASSADLISEHVWLINIPSRQADSLLFAAEKGGRIGPWKETRLEHTVSVTDPAFASETAEAYFSDEDTLSITVRVTQSVRNIRLVNSKQVTTGNISISAASLVDRYINENNHGRYADWTFAVSAGSAPAYLQIGESQIGVTISYPVEQLPKYNQFDGSWKKVSYRHSDLQTSGCAIFALANALARLGITGDGTDPAELADTYAFCLVEGGTLNSTLIGNAAKKFGFRTRYDLYDDPDQVAGFFSQGAVFSFSVVKGHIALADGITSDGSMIHVTDSALGATFSRLEDAVIWVKTEDGSFVRASSPSQVPDAVYYIETNAWSGGEYYLPAEYALARGLRLILKK